MFSFVEAAKKPNNNRTKGFSSFQTVRTFGKSRSVRKSAETEPERASCTARQRLFLKQQLSIRMRICNITMTKNVSVSHMFLPQPEPHQRTRRENKTYQESRAASHYRPMRTSDYPEEVLLLALHLKRQRCASSVSVWRRRQ